MTRRGWMDAVVAAVCLGAVLWFIAMMLALCLITLRAEQAQGQEDTLTGVSITMCIPNAVCVPRQEGP